MTSFSPRIAPSDSQGEVAWKRVISADPRAGWWLALPSKLLPKQVEQIKRAGLGGDLWQQWQLQALMMSSWPMFLKCAHELRQGIANSKYTVRAYATEGEKPTKRAQEKAALVRRALLGMKPEPNSDECGRLGAIYHLTDAILNGVSSLEIQWSDVNGEILPRAATWVHPRHYSFTTDGKLTVHGNSNTGTTLEWKPKKVAAGMTPDEFRNKFIWGQFLSQSGSTLASGLTRPLSVWWSYWIYGREWISVMAQKHGTPFLDITHKAGELSASERSQFNAWAQDAGANNYILHPLGTEVKVTAAQTLGSNNPIESLMRQADEACQYLLLGQTGTTTATPGKLGGEDSHDAVKRENVEAGAGWVANALTEQLVPAVLRMNYGDEDECPIIEADFTEVASPEKQASRWAVLTGMNMPPVLKSEFYQENSLTEPKPGDEVVKNGQVGLMPNADVEVNAVPMPMMPPEQMGDTGGAFNGTDEDDEAVEARHMAKIRRVLASASDDELDTLEGLVRAAELAGGNNGEHKAVKAKLEELSLCKR